MKTKREKKPRKYWYFVTLDECVLCSGGNTYRERRYTKKPKDPLKRMEYRQHACSHHFI